MLIFLKILIFTFRIKIFKNVEVADANPSKEYANNRYKLRMRTPYEFLSVQKYKYNFN